MIWDNLSMSLYRCNVSSSGLSVRLSVCMSVCPPVCHADRVSQGAKTHGGDPRSLTQCPLAFIAISRLVAFTRPD